MQRFAELAVEARAALLSRESQKLKPLMDANFDLRRTIMDLAPGHIRMVETARTTGASAKFAGSGGAIIGTFDGDQMFANLRQKLGAIGCEVFRLER
jgi:glucuronokinase